MALFRYEVRDTRGETLAGVLEGVDEGAASQRLAGQGYEILTLARAPGQESRPERPPPTKPASWSSRPPGGTEMRLLVHQIADCLEAGLTPHRTFLDLAGRTSVISTRRRLEKLAESTSRGQSLSGCLAQTGWLAPHELGLLRAGELGGSLPTVFRWIAEDRERRAELERRNRPWLLFAQINWFCLWLIAPLAAGLFAAIPTLDVGAGAAAALRALGFVSLPGAALSVWGSRLPVLGPFLRAAARRLPGVDTSAMDSRVVLLRTLHLLLSAGVGPAPAWEAAVEAIPNEALARRAAERNPAVRADGRISTGLAGSGWFPAETVAAVRRAEDAGSLHEELMRQGEISAAEAAAGQSRSGPILAAWSVGAATVLSLVVGVALLAGYFRAVFKLADGF